MRGMKAWINLLTLFALVLAQVPSSVLASLLPSAQCEMPCCQRIAASLKPVGKPASCCERAPSDATFSGLEQDRCSCKIQSAPSHPDQPLGVLTHNQYPQKEVKFFSLPEPFSFSLDSVLPRQVLVFSSDSGPPIQRPFYAWLGRGPPMNLS